MPVDHQQRAGQLWPLLTEAAARRETLTYGQAATAIGIHHRPIRYALSPIQDYCLDQGLPWLTALVVSATTGRQGAGYLGEPGNVDDVEEVFQENWAVIENPFSHSHTEYLDGIADELLTDVDSAPDRYVPVLSRGDRQRVFRRAVLRAYGYRCAVCANGYHEVLEAAHIIPWASRRQALRIDVRNGICLCANHHKLFDTDVLRIGSDYVISVSDFDMSSSGYSDSDKAATIDHHGQKISLPDALTVHPSRKLLAERLRASE